MQQIFSVNEMYARYTDGRIGRKEFESFIFENILDDFRRFNLSHWDEDDSADFISWIYPRIRSAINAYSDTGSTFETYLGAVVHWAAREYRFKATDNRYAEYTAWAVRVPELYAHENSPEYSVDDNGDESSDNAGAAGADETAAGEPGIKKYPRQLLILILKCYCYLSDDFLDRIAPKAGIDKAELRALVDKLRQNRLERDDKLRSMRENLYRQFFRCIIYERRLALMPENSCLALRMRTRLEKARRRLVAMRRRIKKMRPGASNRQVAEILGLSKGTVDSSLYQLKKWWKNNPGNVILN